MCQRNIWKGAQLNTAVVGLCMPGIPFTPELLLIRCITSTDAAGHWTPTHKHFQECRNMLQISFVCVCPRQFHQWIKPKLPLWLLLADVLCLIRDMEPTLTSTFSAHHHVLKRSLGTSRWITIPRPSFLTPLSLMKAEVFRIIRIS